MSLTFSPLMCIDCCCKQDRIWNDIHKTEKNEMNILSLLTFDIRIRDHLMRCK